MRHTPDTSPKTRHFVVRIMRNAVTARIVAVVVAFAGIGILMLSLSSAATTSLPNEAENGALGGNASVLSAASASNGAAVQFGNSSGGKVVAPSRLQVFPGGDSIGVTWNPGYTDNTWTDHYNVYRNGVKIATTAPDPNFAGTANGSQYIDKNVTAGQQYSYQVEGVAANGQLTGRTATVNGTLSTSGVPIPTVTLDPSLKANVTAAEYTWFQNYVIPVLKTWYPKISNVLAQPGYMPPSTIIIKSESASDFDAHYPGAAAVTIRNAMIISPTSLASDRDYMSAAIVHESVHVMQYYDNGVFKGPAPRWFVEGLAVFGATDIYNGYPYSDGLALQDPQNDYYTDGYISTAAFIRWIHQHYSSTYAHDANVAGHNGTYDSRYVTFSDGRNIDQAWGLFQNITTRTGSFVSNAGSKCIEDPNSNMNTFTPVVVTTCASGNPYSQRLTYHPVPTTNNAIITLLGHCLSADGITNGSSVVIDYCNDSDPYELWIKQSDGTIVNPQSGRCLEINGGSASPANGSTLAIRDCTGSTWQKWSTP